MKKLISAVVMCGLFCATFSFANDFDDSTRLVDLKGSVQIRLSSPVYVPPVISWIIGNRGIIHLFEGKVLEEVFRRHVQSPYRYLIIHSKSEGETLLKLKPHCWITLHMPQALYEKGEDGKSHYQNAFYALNGNRDLRLRSQRPFSPWLDKNSLTVVASVLGDKARIYEKSPQLEAVFCSKGGPASEFTVGDLKQAFGEYRTEIIVR